MPEKSITVMQVFTTMGIVPTNDQSWAVGSRVATLYVEAFGEQPPKDLRPKTNGPGSHCFALYPLDWEPKIRAVIDAVVGFDRAQGSLL